MVVVVVVDKLEQLVVLLVLVLDQPKHSFL